MNMVVVAGLAITLQACGESRATDADYPAQAIDYVVPYDPGGSTDPVGREFSRLLSKELGTTATVLNRPGGDETIGVTSVVDADPDGYTLGLSSATGIIVQPLVNDSLSYKKPSDFTSVVKMVEAPNVLLVAANSPFKSLNDLIDAARKSPGKIRVGTTGRLTNNTFALVSLEKQANIDLSIVPFSGGAGEAVRAAMGGQIEAVIPTAAAQLGLLKAGKVRALAHTGSKDYDPFLPGAQSFEEAGFDIPFSSDYVTVAAPGLPSHVAEKLTAAALKVAKSDAWAAWCKEKGFLADPMAGDELDKWIQSSIESSREAMALVEATEK